MFNEADLLPLPVVSPTPGIESPSGLYRVRKANEDAAHSSSAEGIAAASSQADTRADAAAPPPRRRGLLDKNARCNVVEACAMAGDNIALALTDGRLCHGNLSRILKLDAKSVDGDDPFEGGRARSGWSTWNSRHGKVLELHHSPAHDALMTLELASTAAGDQVFLARYHKPNALGGAEREGLGPKGRSQAPWESCTIPLATNQACMAVCPRRGWAAVCTGSVVNMWAVSWPGSGGSKGQSSKQRQSLTGFEHALAVDLAELVGTDAQSGTDGGAKHIAILGNTLAVATDYVVFVLRLSFDVKGEATSSDETPPHADSPTLRPSRGEGLPVPQCPSISSSSTRPSQGGKPNRGARTPAGAEHLPPKVAARNGNQKGKHDDSGAQSRTGSLGGGKEGRVASGRVPSSAGRSSGRDGVVEGVVSDAEDMVVCVLQSGGDDDGSMGVKGPAPPPALLRSFDDDWEAFGTRGAHSEDGWWELETNPPITSVSPAGISVMENPAVIARAGGCEVLLARRVGAGEVLKGLSLVPISSGDDHSPDGSYRSPLSETECGPLSSLSCRLVVLTNKAATVCLICTTPVDTPSISSLLSPASAPSPSSSSSPLSSGSSSYRSERRDKTITDARSSPPSHHRMKTRHSAGGESHAGPGDWPPRVFLRRCCRFNHDLLRASIMRCFLFALTVDGLEVWTFPSDSLPAAENRAEVWLEEAVVGAHEMGASQRPCLLHVQRLEMEGMMPRSPGRSVVAIGGARPGVVIFPAADEDQTLPELSSIAFLGWQSRQRLRTAGAVDECTFNNTGTIFPSSSSRPHQHVLAAVAENDAGDDQREDFWQAKWAAWREGFCGIGGNTTGGSNASSVALVLRLRTPTEAFRLLAAAEARAPHPRLQTVSAAFLAAAEGLHGALTAEATTCWRAAVSPSDRKGTNRNSSRRPAGSGEEGSSGGMSVGIESILPKLVQCCTRQRVAARCASLVGRLWLEEAQRAAATTGGGDETDMIHTAAQAYARACSWLLESDESIMDCCNRLKEAASRVVEVLAPDTEACRSDAAVGRGWIEMPSETVEGPEPQSAGEGDAAHSSPSIHTRVSVGLERSLYRIMHENYLLRALGVGANSNDTSAVLGSRSPLAPRDYEDFTDVENVLAGLVDYLHGRDTKRALQPSIMRDIEVGDGQAMSLAVAVICARRAPWFACPNALSLAIRALDEQEKSLAEQSPVSSSSSSNSGRSSLSRSSSGESGTDRRSLGRSRRNKVDKGSTSSGGVARKSKSKVGGRRENRQAELTLGSIGDEQHGRMDDNNASRAWIAVARVVLHGYREMTENTAAKESHTGDSCRGAEDAILQLACERHPALVAPKAGGAGPLARSMLAAGRLRPLVLALVHLTSCYTAGGRTFGPHRVEEVLELTGKCFTPTVDPLHALRVLGAGGRQIAARLESLKRASLDAAAEEDSCTLPSRRESFDPLELDGAQFGSAVLNRIENRDMEVSETAASEFLSRRCAVSLAQANRGTRQEERLAEALGAPAAWQASLSQNRAVDRAILRHLIAAHLDDLRTLEGPSSGRTQPARQYPTDPGFTSGNGIGSRKSGDGDGSCWTDVVVPLLTGSPSQGDVGAAEGHLAAIVALVREVTWRGNGGNGSGMSPEEAAEVATEAKRRLPAPMPASRGGFKSGAHSQPTTETVAWGAGGVGQGMQRSTWPWPPRGVPLSAVGAIVALAAALPPSGKLLAGVDVMLQVLVEVVGAARAEAAVAAGVAAAAAAAERGVTAARRPPAIAAGGGLADGEVGAVVNDVSEASERALKLYVKEYCGTDPGLWAAVITHVKHVLLNVGDGARGSGDDSVMDVGAADRLVRGLLRKCGEELGGADLVRALPEALTLSECLDEVERVLSVEESINDALGVPITA